MSNNRKTRGITQAQEINEEFIQRDTTPRTKRFLIWLSNPQNAALFVGSLAGAGFYAPAIADIMLILSGFVTWWAVARRHDMPLKMPIVAAQPDPRNPDPDPKRRGKLKNGEGIFYLGTDLVTGRQAWLTNDDCRQHFLVLGTTGAGKTETLIGFVANALTWSSGCLFCDGKGDVSLFAKLYMLARRFGREDDVLVLNFMTGNRDIGAGGWGMMSNSLNPFSTGASDSLTQMVVSLMDDAGGDGGMWKGRATAMFTGVMRALTYLRDQNVVDLNVGTIRDYLNLKRIIDLASVKKNPDLPGHIRKSLQSYLTSLPGYVEEKEYKQAQTTLDQHGYLEMQFTRIMGSLADVYGHIFSTPFGEVDMHDVVLNRRILVIMLPALEKAGDEIANLGKIVVANLKGMMGGTLGSEIEGSWNKVVKVRVTNAPSPFLVILDEVGYYTVEGMALMAAQARSLGFSMVYASQDISAMKRLADKEADSIIGNTNIKIYMRTEDPDKTAELATKRGGKAIRTQLRGYQGEVGEIGGQLYRDQTEAGLEQGDVINFRDLADQSEGEMHITFKSLVVRARGFYASPSTSFDAEKHRIKPNHFIQVEKPSLDDVEHVDRMPDVLERLLDPGFAAAMAREAVSAKGQILARAEAGDEIAMAAMAFDDYRTRRPKQSLAEAASAAVFHVARAVMSNGAALAGAAVASKSALAAAGRPIAVQRADIPPDAISAATSGRMMLPEDLDDEDMIPPSSNADKAGWQAAIADAAANKRVPPPSRPGQPIAWRPPSDVPPADLMDNDFVPPDDDEDIGQFIPADIQMPQARPVLMRTDLDHRTDIAGRTATATDEMVANDAVMRMLSDLDFDPTKVTREEVEEKVFHATGSGPVPETDTRENREAIDAAAYAVERAIDPAPSLAQGDGTETGFITDFLSSLLDTNSADEDEVAGA
ncbi:TraM recognition domain-containing protein [Bosea sp. RAC05]|uniref:TraM recognition domain-containing protein n=1 Tax=Bosea sp. RAC05 TaxID=1842539 RepID=UPI00083CBF61|nr:TraM recognition domain-containing protein [Bosea sp. RAC05]AOG03116.1 type IV secretory system Conjugative DNA transfer family protein [Bosea sp. RAC05]